MFFGAHVTPTVSLAVGWYSPAKKSDTSFSWKVTSSSPATDRRFSRSMSSPTYGWKWLAKA